MKGTIKFKGGSGSGNFGHSGRPGKVGGSGGGNTPGTSIIAFDFEDYEIEDTYGVDAYTVAEQADSIVKSAGIYVSRDKDLRFVALDEDGNVQGASYVSASPERYSFDVVVDKDYRGMGIGSKLIDDSFNDYEQSKEVFPGIKMELDVVNPLLVDVFKRRGLRVVSATEDHTYMEMD